jgi:predicted flavoprotein YhiN
MAAIHAAERGRKFLLLEKGRKPGVKILMSCGTRCEAIQRLLTFSSHPLEAHG